MTSDFEYLQLLPKLLAISERQVMSQGEIFTKFASRTPSIQDIWIRLQGKKELMELPCI